MWVRFLFVFTLLFLFLNLKFSFSAINECFSDLFIFTSCEKEDFKTDSEKELFGLYICILDNDKCDENLNGMNKSSICHRSQDFYRNAMMNIKNKKDDIKTFDQYNSIYKGVGIDYCDTLSMFFIEKFFIDNFPERNYKFITQLAITLYQLDDSFLEKYFIEIGMDIELIKLSPKSIFYNDAYYKKEGVCGQFCQFPHKQYLDSLN